MRVLKAMGRGTHLSVEFKGTVWTRYFFTNWQEFPVSYQSPWHSRQIYLPASCLSQELWTTSLCVKILPQSGFKVKTDSCYLHIPTHSWFLVYIPVSHPLPRLSFRFFLIDLLACAFVPGNLGWAFPLLSAWKHPPCCHSLEAPAMQFQKASCLMCEGIHSSVKYKNFWW